MKNYWLFIAFCILTQAAWGFQEDSLSMDLEPVVVTGTRYEMQKRKVASPISIIDRATLDQSGQINVLPVLVNQVPGFFLNDRGVTGFGVGPNSGGNISIRGISGSPNNRVLVLIDGQPQFMGIFAHPIADAYTSSDIERVEVQRGAASLLYGSNAMGGAINLITRKAKREGWQGGANVGYGSYGTFLGSAHAGYRKGKFHSMVSVNRNQTNGYRDDAPDSFENTTFYAKTGYEISDSYTISSEIQLSDATYFQPGTTEAPEENDRREFLRGRAAASLLNDNGFTSGALMLYHNFGDHQFLSGFESKDQNQGITFYQNLSLMTDQILTVGLDYKRFGGRAFNENMPPPARIGLGEQHWVNETEVYAHIQQSIGKSLHLNAGIRQVENSQFGGRTLPGFGISWEAGSHTTLKASSAKAFRSPSVVDLFLFPPSNEELLPEEMWNHEIGITQEFLNQKLYVEANVFLAKGENLIVVSPMEQPPVGRNTGSFTNKGIETQVKYRFGEGLEWIANYCFVDVSENVLFAPRHHFNTQATLRMGKFNLLPSLQYINGLNIGATPDADVPSSTYTLLNMRLAYAITPKIQAYINGNNLTNAQYQVERGYPMPGINIISGIQVKI
ncbi:TonB-dependent receptor [Pleomorphovibrio marinus]|uniref:TonB-dependent receptor n=1 Tax=Pleomorphovibrio marinus TaxID=2164132 RepID=UPI000E0B9457|nr:TonB-dependent receptor [Pleomorphovibrio marinus]